MLRNCYFQMKTTWHSERLRSQKTKAIPARKCALKIRFARVEWLFAERIALKIAQVNNSHGGTQPVSFARVKGKTRPRFRIMFARVKN